MEISLLCHVVLGSLPIESRSDISEHMLNFLDFSGISGQNQVDVNFLHSSGITGENQVDVNFLDFSGITGGNQVDVNFLDFSGITGGNQVDVNFLDFSAIDAENKVDGNTSPTDHQFELLETRPRFTSSHNFILKEILSLSGVNGPETERELFARASDAFQRENLRSIGFSSFATHLRRLQKTKTTALSMLPSQLEALEQFRDCSLKFDQAFEAIETKFRSKNIPLISKAVCKKVWNSLGLGAGRLKISRAHIRIIERLVSRHHYQPTDRAVLYKKACKLFAKAGLGPISMRVFIEHHTLVQRNTILTDLATDQLHDDIDSPQPSPISQPDYSNNVLNPSEFILIPPSDNNSEGATFINLLPPNWDQESISFPDFNLEKVQETTPSSDFNSEGANIIDLLPLNWNQETIQLSEFNSEKVQETTPPSDFNSEGANIIDLLPLNWAQETIQLSDFNSEGANFINLLPLNWAQESISFPDFNLEKIQETTPPADVNLESSNYLNLPPVNWAQESISFPDFNLEMVQETTPPADVNSEGANIIDLLPLNWNQETAEPSDFNSEVSNFINLLPVNAAQETISSVSGNYITLIPVNLGDLNPSENTQGATSDLNSANFNLFPPNWANALDSGSLIKPVSFQSREELIEARWTPRHWEILINLVRSVVMFDLGCIKFDSQLHQEGLLQIGKSACEEAWQMLTSSRGENDNTLRSRSNYALHDRIIKSFLLEGTRKPSDLYTQASALFSSADIPPMSKRLFNSHWFSLQCELEHEFGGNSKRCYSARHRQILKEIVQENPDMRHKNILRLATEKFAQEGLIAMTFNTLGPWVTQIKKMQTLSFDNTEAKIDMNADALLTCIFNSSPTIRLPDAMNALREFGNLGGRMLSREEVRTWLANRRKSFRFSLGI